MSFDGILDEYRKVYKKGQLVIFNENCTKLGVIDSIWEIAEDCISLKKEKRIQIRPCSLTIDSLSNVDTIYSIRTEPTKVRFCTCRCLNYYNASNDELLSYLLEK